MSAEKRKRRRKPLKRRYKVLIALGIAVALVLLAWMALDVVASAALNRELAYLEAAGETLNLADLAPPPVPDEENAALVYEKGFALLVGTASDTENALIYALQDNEPWSETKRKRIASQSGAKPLSPSAVTESAAWAAARRRLARNKKALDLIRQATAMKRCRFDVNYAGGISSYLPSHLAPLRETCRLLSLSARVKSHDGDWPGTYRDITTSLRLERATRQPMLISHIHGDLVIDLSLRDALRALKQDTDHPEEWRRLFAEIEAVNRKPVLVKAFQGERALMATELERMRREASAFSTQGINVKRPWRVRARIMPLRQELKLQEAGSLRYMRPLVAAARLPPHKALAEIKTIDARAAKAPMWSTFARIMFPAFLGTFEAHVRTEARLALAKVTLALKLYKHRHGAYPEDLSALAPEILETVPVDPFTGKPLIYRRAGKGFIIYSVGEDLTDNGASGPATATQPSKRLDIVWQVEK